MLLPVDDVGPRRHPVGGRQEDLLHDVLDFFHRGGSVPEKVFRPVQHPDGEPPGHFLVELPRGGARLGDGGGDLGGVEWNEPAIPFLDRFIHVLFPPL